MLFWVTFISFWNFCFDSLFSFAPVLFFIFSWTIFKFDDSLVFLSRKRHTFYCFTTHLEKIVLLLWCGAYFTLLDVPSENWVSLATKVVQIRGRTTLLQLHVCKLDKRRGHTILIEQTVCSLHHLHLWLSSSKNETFWVIFKHSASLNLNLLVAHPVQWPTFLHFSYKIVIVIITPVKEGWIKGKLQIFFLVKNFAKKPFLTTFHDSTFFASNIHHVYVCLFHFEQQTSPLGSSNLLLITGLQ